MPLRLAAQLLILAHLQIAKKEKNEPNHLSEEVNRRIFAIDPKLKSVWLALDRDLQKRMDQTEKSKLASRLDPEQRTFVCDLNARGDDDSLLRKREPEKTGTRV